MKIDSLNLKSVQGIMYSHLYEWPDMEEPLQLRYFIEIPMVSVNTVKANTKHVVDASLYLECIKFGGVQERNWRHLEGKSFDFSDSDGQADAYFYCNNEFGVFDAMVKFGSINGSIIEVEIHLRFDFEFKRRNKMVADVVIINGQLEFLGFMLFPTDILTTLKDIEVSLPLMHRFIDTTVYHHEFVDDATGFQRLYPNA